MRIRCQAKRAAHTRSYRERHPEKLRAHIAVNTALRNGTLVRQPCENCHDARSHAHHDDYDKPLAVRWLCHSCHREHHAKERGDIPRKPLLTEAEKAQRAAHAESRRRKAVEMRLAGADYPTIGRYLGVTKSTAFKWVNNPSYK